MSELINEKSMQFIRRGAQIIDIAVTGTIMFIIIAHIVDGDLPVLSELGTYEKLMFLGMGMALSGGIVALKWERNGGLLLAGGALLFMTVDSFGGSAVSVNPIFLTLFIIGVLFIYLSSNSKR